MPLYSYVAFNPATGDNVKAAVEAANEDVATKLIGAQGLVPTKIKLATTKKGAGRIQSILKNRVPAKERVLFSRQLSTLINAGLPLMQALQSVNNQTENPGLKAALMKIIADVEGGATLADSMAKHPKIFNEVYISMVAAGETSGTLDKALERLAIQQEKDSDSLSKIKGAMIYPLIIMVVMLAVLGFMIVKVLPQVSSLYSSMPGTKLPAITSILMDISSFIIHFWWLTLILLIAAIFALRWWSKTPKGISIIDAFYMRGPLIKDLFMKLYMARFTRTASTLISSGVPLLQMLDVVARGIDNVHIEKSIRRAIESVKGGRGLAESIENDPSFLPLVPNMIKIGEQSGSMDQMMAKAADYYEKELDNQIKSIQTIIEPVMMIMMGVVAFIIVAAVLLPIYGLANQPSLGV